jgi:hypothetical protein
MQQREVTGWVGWAVFAAIMMILIGILDIIGGLIAIFDDDFVFVGGARSGVYVVDESAWGWWTLVVGILLMFAGFAVLRGALWGRTIGVVLAGLNAIGHITIIASHPIWSTLIIILDVLIIYALIVHGGELREDY